MKISRVTLLFFTLLPLAMCDIRRQSGRARSPRVRTTKPAPLLAVSQPPVDVTTQTSVVAPTQPPTAASQIIINLVTGSSTPVVAASEAAAATAPQAPASAAPQAPPAAAPQAPAAADPIPPAAASSSRAPVKAASVPEHTRRTYPTTSYPIITSTQRVPKAPAVIIRNPANLNLQGLEPFKTNFACKEGNGYYAVNNECDSYIECKHDQAKKYWCPDGLHFNPNAKRHEYPCAYPSVVKCNAGAEQQIPRASGQCPRQYGYFPMNDGDCSKYIVCQEGVATIMPCPAGLVFDASSESCNYVENVPQCHPNAFKDFTCPEPPLDEDGYVSDTVYNYKYGSQCKVFIACERGYPRLLSCDQGQAFDEESQSCIDEDYVQDCAKSYAASS